jgi:transforming growth factor-beta-induced protein
VADLEELFLCAVSPSCAQRIVHSSFMPSQGPFTVLAPVNDAFAILDPAFVRELMQTSMIEKLRAILLYHIVPKHRPVTSFVAGELETLLEGENVTVGVDPLRFDRADVVRPNMAACNGVIHSIETVRLPSGSDFCPVFPLDQRRSLQAANTTCTSILGTARNEPALSTVVSLLNTSGLAAILEKCNGPFTALLPSNDAFKKLTDFELAFLMNPANRNVSRDILLFHLLSGSTNSSMFRSGPRNTMLQGKQVNISLSPLRFHEAAANRSDIETCQGVVHILDGVLLPYALPAFCDEYTFNPRKRHLQNGGPNCTRNILDAAKQTADLTIVTTLIDIAGLTPVFSCAGPFTAILPSNTAFDDVPEAFLDELILEQNIDKLRAFLLHHIIPGAMLTSQLSAGPRETLSKVKINVSVKPLEFNGFFLFSADVPACNGYLNVVSGLLS